MRLYFSLELITVASYLLSYLSLPHASSLLSFLHRWQNFFAQNLTLLSHPWLKAFLRAQSSTVLLRNGLDSACPAGCLTLFCPQSLLSLVALQDMWGALAMSMPLLLLSLCPKCPLPTGIFRVCPGTSSSASWLLWWGYRVSLLSLLQAWICHALFPCTPGLWLQHSSNSIVNCHFLACLHIRLWAPEGRNCTGWEGGQG